MRQYKFCAIRKVLARSFEYWTDYMRNNNYTITLGGTTTSTEDDHQAISVCAVVDQMAYVNMAISKEWNNNFDERDKLIEAAGKISEFVKWVVCGC